MLCPLCHSPKNKEIFIADNTHGKHLYGKQKFVILKCQQCLTIFPKVKVDQNYYQTYYPNNYYPPHYNIFSKYYYQLSSKLKVLSLQKILPHNQKIKILDIGCGDGNFLDSLPRKRFIKYGIDTNPDAVKICLSKNIHAFQANIGTPHLFKQMFNLITLNHVFEHLSSPESSLTNIHHLLKKGGYLIMSLPLNNSLGFLLGNKFWFHLDPPRHLYIPKKYYFIKYLEKHEFKVKKIIHHPFEFPLDLFWSLKNYPLYWPLLIVYPLLKLFDWETATFVCQKK